MPDHYTDIDELLAKQLAGEASPEEAQRIDDWLRASSHNQEYFNSLQRLWQQAAGTRTLPAVDVEAALRKVKTALPEHSAPRARVIRLRTWLPAAAAALVLLIAAILFFRTPAVVQPLEIAATTATLTDTLSDGSVVVLNRQSGLRVATNFNRRERRLRLTGEAYFQVAHDTSRAFVVEVEQLEIQVLGTEFNVDSRSETGFVTVVVAAGKVQLRSTVQTEYLYAGQQAVYEAATGKITRQAQAKSNVLAYKNRQFRFDGTPLREVIRQLSDVYGVEIILKNKVLETCPLSAPFNNLELDQVLDIVATSFDLTIEKSGETILIDGNGCGE